MIQRDQERAAKIAHMQRLVTDGIVSGRGDKSMSELLELARKEVSAV